jgi:hypothetical protein
MLSRLNLPTEFNPVTVLLSVIFVGVGLLFTYFLGRVTTLECSHQLALAPCNLHTTWMGLVDLSDRPLSRVYSAHVEENCSDGCTYRVSIVTDQGNIPLDSAYISDYADRVSKVDTINAYLADPEAPPLNVQDGGGLWMVFPLIFVATGLWMGLAPILGQFLANRSRGMS